MDKYKVDMKRHCYFEDERYPISICDDYIFDPELPRNSWCKRYNKEIKTGEDKMEGKKFSEKLKEAFEKPSEEIEVLEMPKKEKEDIIRVEHKEGYDLITRKVFWENEEPFEITSAYTPDGLYIGDERRAEFLVEEKGIKPEIAPHIPDKCNSNQKKVCSIGFCEKEQKWYGWSHRAIFGFGIGYVAEKGACVCSSGWTKECLREHPDWDRSIQPGTEVKTLEDAKNFAIAFADSVG